VFGRNTLKNKILMTMLKVEIGERLISIFFWAKNKLLKKCKKMKIVV
jgi:hypothetical protein